MCPPLKDSLGFKIVVKGENVDKAAFSVFPTWISTPLNNNLMYCVTFNLLSAIMLSILAKGQTEMILLTLSKTSPSVFYVSAKQVF